MRDLRSIRKDRADKLRLMRKFHDRKVVMAAFPTVRRQVRKILEGK